MKPFQKALIALCLITGLTYFFGCKEADIVTTTENCWKMHSAVPIDSTLR